jgi:tetratricopeptide (TPR) repeat protein
LFRALALAFCAFAQSPPDYEQGVALFDSGQFAAALPFLERAAKADPQNAQKWKAVGVTYAALKKYADAEETLGRACRLDYKVPDACFFYARTLYALDRYEDSLAALEHADPRSWRARLARAVALEALSRADRAEHEFRESLSLCRNADPSPAAAYGRFLIRQARAPEAIPRLEEALTHHPNNPEAHLWLGRALFDTNKFTDALPHLERAVALIPTSAQAHLLLAKTYIRLNRPTEAEPHLQKAAKYGEEK